MKAFPLSIGFAACAFLLAGAGCANSSPIPVLPEARPLPLTKADRGGGSLLVYSAVEEHNDGGLMYYPHTGYQLCAVDGRLIRVVRNHLGNTDEAPENVSLPAGRYLVIADSNREGRVKVPVVIASGRTTEVRLDHTSLYMAAQRRGGAAREGK